MNAIVKPIVRVGTLAGYQLVLAACSFPLKYAITARTVRELFDITSIREKTKTNLFFVCPTHTILFYLIKKMSMDK